VEKACFCLGEEDKQQRIRDGKTVRDREKIMLQNYIHIFVIYVCVCVYIYIYIYELSQTYFV
jgi:hypothetical protein